MNEDKINQLKVVADLIRQQRRYYNVLLNKVVAGEATEYNSEDLMRLVGTLEAAYNHALASIASDGDIYCLLKHLSYAIILVGELDNPNVEALYEIIAIISDGKIEPCEACKQDANNSNARNESES